MGQFLVKANITVRIKKSAETFSWSGLMKLSLISGGEFFT